MTAADDRRALLRDLAIVGLLAAIAFALRWTGLVNDAFHNEDVAGITYNADLLRAGGLPYKDDLEWKAPGSFYLVWGIWEVFGRSLVVLQRFMAGWAVLAAAGIYVGGVALYGRRVGVAAALLYVFCSPITDSIDINYGAWMIAPYIWATVFALLALKRGRLGWWVAAGASLALAGLLKRQAAVLFPLFALMIVLWPRLKAPEGWRGPGNRPLALAGLGVGLAIGFAPLMLHAAAHDGLGEFVQHYFFSDSGWRYVAKTELTAGDKLLRLGDGLMGFFAYIAGPTTLALLTAGLTLRSGEARQPGVRGVFLAAHFGLSFVGAALGLRFFKGYYLQILPAAVWLAAHPRGPLLGWWPLYRVRVKSWRRFALQAGLLVAVLAPSLRQDLRGLNFIRRRRLVVMDREAAEIGAIIRNNSTAEQRIWVWGRWAWPVYYHADRLAPGRFYKVLGVLTNNLTNTWRRPTEKTEFTLDSPWEEVTAELVEGRPAFIAVARNEGYGDWKAFRDLLSRDYRRVKGLGQGGLRLYKRKDHPWVQPPPGERQKTRVKRRTKAEQAKASAARRKAAREKAAARRKAAWEKAAREEAAREAGGQVDRPTKPRALDRPAVRLPAGVKPLPRPPAATPAPTPAPPESPR